MVQGQRLDNGYNFMKSMLKSRAQILICMYTLPDQALITNFKPIHSAQGWCDRVSVYLPGLSIFKKISINNTEALPISKVTYI